MIMMKVITMPGSPGRHWHGAARMAIVSPSIAQIIARTYKKWGVGVFLRRGGEACRPMRY